MADFLGQLLVLGLPQGLTFYLASGRASLRQASTISAAHSLVLVSAGWCLWVCSPVGGALILSAAAAAIHATYRAVVLKAYHSIVFNIISALPGLSLVGMALTAPLHRPDDAKLIVTAAYALTAAITIATLGKNALAFPPSFIKAETLKKMLSYSLWCAPVPVMAPAMIAGTYQILQWRSGGPSLSGLFSIPLLVVSTSSLPISLLGAVLFKRWSEEFSQGMRTRTFERSMQLFAVIGVLATPVVVAAGIVGVRYVFGQRFALALIPCIIIGMGTYAMLISRVLGTALLSFDLTPAYAINTAARAALVFLVTAIGFPNLLAGAALAWVGGDILAIYLAVIAIANKTALPPSRILGLQINELWAHHAR